MAVVTPSGLASSGETIAPVFNVQSSYGAKGDGVTDDTTAIQNAINAASAAGGGLVYFPKGNYAISSTITIPTKVSLLGDGSGVELIAGAAGLTWSPVSELKWIGALHGTMVSVSGPAKIGMKGLGFDGVNTADYGLHFDQLQASVIDDIGVQKCLVDHIWLGTTSSTAGANSQHNRFSSIFVMGQNAFGSAIRLTGNAGKTANATLNTFERVVLIFGEEGLYLDDADSNEFIGVFCYPQSGASYAVHFAPDARQNRFLGLAPNGGVYVDTPTVASYSNLIIDYDRSNGEAGPTFNTGGRLEYWETGLNGNGLTITTAVKPGINPLAYSASITPNLSDGPWQTVTVTNATAFTVNAPSNPPSSVHTASITVEVLNSSGGAMGAITWNAAYVFNGFTWTNPASTKRRFARFDWNGANWICSAIATADY